MLLFTTHSFSCSFITVILNIFFWLSKLVIKNMASKEEVFNLSAQREVLRSFSLSDTKMSVGHNPQHAHAHHVNLMHQWVAAEDALEMTWLLDAKCEGMEQIIEEEQAHRTQVATLTQMQLQDIERVEEQERELRRLTALLVEHQEVLRPSPERPQQEPPQPVPPRELGQLRHEVEDILPGTVNAVMGAASTAGQVPGLGRPTNNKEGHISRYSCRCRRWGPTYPSEVGPVWQCGNLYTYSKFRKLHEPKVPKFKGEYSSDASLMFQSWLKDIQVYVLEHCLSHWEAIQLVRDNTSEQAWSEVEYYLGLTPKSEQSFQGLIDHLRLAFQSCETGSSLIADFYNWSQKARRDWRYVCRWAASTGKKDCSLKAWVYQWGQPGIEASVWPKTSEILISVMVARAQCLSSPNSKTSLNFGVGWHWFLAAGVSA